MLTALKAHRLSPIVVFAVVAASLASTSFGNADDTAKAESKDPIVAGQVRLNKAVDAADVVGAQAAKALFEKALGDEKTAPVAHYYLGYADSCVASFLQGDARKNAAKLLKSAISHLETAVKLDSKYADAHAMLASCYGQMIEFAPEGMMELGPKAQETMAVAMGLEPTNPRVLLLHGVSTMHTPEAFGGGRKLALPILEKAAKTFDSYKSKDPHEPSWGHDQAHCWLALIYHDLGRKEEAQKSLAKALEINPKSGLAIYYVKPRISAKDEKGEKDGGG